MGVDDTNLDELIREHLTRTAPLGRRSAGFPSIEEYHSFVTGKMKGETLDRMLAYLREHPEERDFIVTARDAAGNAERKDLPRPPARWIRNAEKLRGPASACAHCGARPSNPADGARTWGAIAAGSFLFSFAFPRYFMQFLALAAVLGLRWALEALPRRTQIFVQRSEQPAATSAGRKQERE